MHVGVAHLDKEREADPFDDTLELRDLSLKGLHPRCRRCECNARGAPIHRVTIQ
jgi:hypothetical protein